MEITKDEKQRALNMVWNAAKDYSLLPALRVYSDTGKADLYWNSIIGSVYKHFDFSKIEELFRSFEGNPVEYQLKNLLWLGLESAAYARECKERPALSSLRSAYAKEVLLRDIGHDPTIYERVERARALLFLGKSSEEFSPYCKKLCSLLAFDEQMDTASIIARAKAIFETYFHFQAELDALSAANAPQKKRSSMRLPNFLRLRFGKNKAQTAKGGRSRQGRFGSRCADYLSSGADTENLDYQLSAFSMRSEGELRGFMENFFGASLYTNAQMASMEKQLCTGNHSLCHLHYTNGAFNEKTGYKTKDDYLKMTALRQLEKNRAYFEKNERQAMENIARLTSRIRNSMLTYLQSSVVKSGAGKLNAARVWRSVYLDDEKVFDKELKSDNGDITVDLLLDGSTSQTKRQEKLATQAYILAESLTRCQIPVRVSSFCSLRGFTVFRIFRDYTEANKNKNVFCYFTAGCNRDGLAIRASRAMLMKNASEHRLLILLSDARPNGVQRVRLDNGEYKSYSDELAVRDTAAEVRAGEREDVCVLCVFTGEEDALPNAKLIYSTGFSRIKELDHFADAVGTLIQNEIKNF